MTVVESAQDVLEGEIEEHDDTRLTPVAQIRREKRRLLLRSPGFLFGVFVLIFWVVAAIAPGLLTDRDPNVLDGVPAAPFVDGKIDAFELVGDTQFDGITATLLDSANNPVPGIDSVMTDDAGNYEFTGVEAGSYNVTLTSDEGLNLTRFAQTTKENLVDKGPRGSAWFGADRIGRDVYARTIHGARPIMIAAPVATIIASIIGTFLGLLTGYYRGWFDEIVSRILEAVLSIPAILLAIVIVFTFGPTQPVVIGTIAFLFIPPVARTVRAATLSESQLDYVTAARMRGESSLYIIAREIFPNVIGVVTVEITVRLGYAVFVLATLAFLGISGGNRTTPNWGIDVADNYQRIQNGSWWPTIFPALAIASLVIAVNIIADSIERVNKS